MRFGRLQFWSLLVPLIVVAVPYTFALLVMWRDPGSSLDERGAPVLLVASLVTCIVEFVAVPSALLQMWRHAEYRTITNFLVVAVGGIPVAICIMLVASVLYGHG
jgi:O-antigen/teichoic acid export membrane protein